MGNKIFLFIVLLFSKKILLKSQDTTSKVYFGINIIPVAPLYHIIEDTAWYTWRYSGGLGSGSYYNTLTGINYRTDFNFASGAILFISFNHYMDISFGYLVDVKRYHYTTYYKDIFNRDSLVKQEKYFNYRIPINFKISLSQPHPNQFFLKVGFEGTKRMNFESVFRFGFGFAHRYKCVLLNANLNLGFRKMDIQESYFEKEKLFPTIRLELGCSYDI